MPMATVTLLTQNTSYNPTGGATKDEIPLTRRQIDLQDVDKGRSQYEGNNSGDATIEIQYSKNNGSTWATLIPAGPEFSQDVVGLSNVWTDLPSDAKTQPTVLIRAVGNGSHQLLFSYTIYFIELQYR